MRNRVYIAGPISRGDLMHNVNQATEAFVKLALAGLAPHCPHWFVYSKMCYRNNPLELGGLPSKVLCEATVAGNDAMTHDDWLGIDLAWVEMADAVLRLPGESVGADREVEHAKRVGIPVFESIEQVVAWEKEYNRYLGDALMQLRDQLKGVTEGQIKVSCRVLFDVANVLNGASSQAAKPCSVGDWRAGAASVQEKAEREAKSASCEP